MTRLNLVEGTDEYWIVGLAMKVRNQLGFSMLESVYERALMMEFEKAGVPAERQVSIPVFYDGEKLNHGYAADIIVDNRILLELKAVTRLYAIHRRQLQFYLSAGGIDSGLLINFGNYQKLECERMERADRRKRGELGVNPNGIFRPFSEEEKKNPHESFAERIARIVEMDECSETSGGDA